MLDKRKLNVFRERHFAHFREYLSGAYRIHRPDAFRQGRRDELYLGYGYKNTPWTHAVEFFERTAELYPELAKMIDAMALWLAPLSAPKRIHRRIEGAIVQLLYAAADPEIAAFQELNVRCWARLPTEPTIEVQSQSPVTIRGLPPVFEA